MAWQKGKSGNPAGRPRGQSSTTKLRELITPHAPALVEMLVEQAKKGDVQAAKLLLDRVLPTIKPITQSINISLSNSLEKNGQNIIKEIMRGNLQPEMGGQLITALVNQAKLIETTELMARIEALEKK